MLGQDFWGFLKEAVLRNRDRHAIPVMDGTLKPNDALLAFEVVSDSIEQPDDIAISAAGDLYISTGNRVVRICGERNADQTVLVEFDSPAGGLHFHPDGRLLVCVSGRGVALVDDAGAKSWAEESEGATIRCPTSAVVGPDGMIYIADGSAFHEPERWVFDLMEKRSTGRLIQYDHVSGKSRVLLSGLSYPFGLSITHDGRSIIMTESWSHTLWTYPLDDIRQGAGKRVIGNMPGYPARIVPSAKGGYQMCLFSMRTELVELVLSENKYRNEMMRTIEPNYWVAPSLASGRDFLEPLQGGAVRHMGVIKPWAPPRSYGLVIELDEDFDAVKSYHSRPDGNRHGITGLREHSGELLVVSKGHSLVLKKNKKVVS